MSKWTKPIEFEVAPTGMAAIIPGTEEALIALSECWPTRMGGEYRYAKATCERALAGRVSHDEARQAFLYAADEVGMFVRI